MHAAPGSASLRRVGQSYGPTQLAAFLIRVMAIAVMIGLAPSAAGCSSGDTGALGGGGGDGDGSGSGSDGPGVLTVGFAAAESVAWEGTGTWPLELTASEAVTGEPAANGQPARLWAVKNGPSLLYRLEKNGARWAPSTSDGWASGKPLRFPGGGGSPDSEGVTRAGASGVLYVASERDNDGGASRPGVLRYDVKGTAAALTATHEWNLTGDLPAVGANAGFEAITWIPDSLLVARGFRDDKLGKPYAPSDYPGHGDGLFVLGLEGNGVLYVYALDHGVAGGFTRLASFPSGLASVMALEHDGALLWAGCDDTCDGEMTLFTIDDNPTSPTHGRFVLRRRVARPAGLPNLNDEGIAIAPDAECVNQRKPFFFADDGATGGNALRQGSVACGAF